MTTTYGYARVSTLHQSLELQHEALLNYGIDPENIYMDKVTGKTMDRKSLQQLLKIVKTGDIIIVKKLDRLGRSVSQVTNLIDDLTKKGIYIKSIEDGVDTSNNSAMATAMLQLLAMFSEMERNFIQERTRPAIEAAKEAGVKFGRKEVNKNLYEMALDDYEKNMTLKEIIKKYGTNEKGKDNITEATFFRRLKKRREAQDLQV